MKKIFRNMTLLKDKFPTYHLSFRTRTIACRTSSSKLLESILLVDSIHHEIKISELFEWYNVGLIATTVEKGCLPWDLSVSFSSTILNLQRIVGFRDFEVFVVRKSCHDVSFLQIFSPVPFARFMLHETSSLSLRTKPSSSI